MRNEITNASDLFRKIEDLEMRAKVEERTEKQTVHLVAKWLRFRGYDELAENVEDLEWYPQEWRDAKGKPRK
jgi:hypothetical protein